MKSKCHFLRLNKDKYFSQKDLYLWLNKLQEDKNLLQQISPWVKSGVIRGCWTAERKFSVFFYFLASQMAGIIIVVIIIIEWSASPDFLLNNEFAASFGFFSARQTWSAIYQPGNINKFTFYWFKHRIFWWLINQKTSII